jgi:hypothetical protein
MELIHEFLPEVVILLKGNPQVAFCRYVAIAMVGPCTGPFYYEP